MLIYAGTNFQVSRLSLNQLFLKLFSSSAFSFICMVNVDFMGQNLLCTEDRFGQASTSKQTMEVTQLGTKEKYKHSLFTGFITDIIDVFLKAS